MKGKNEQTRYSSTPRPDCVVCIHAAGDGDLLGIEAKGWEAMSWYLPSVMGCLGPVFRLVFVLAGTPIYNAEDHLILTTAHVGNYCIGPGDYVAPGAYVGMPE